MTLLNLVERDDPRMKWSSSHPNYAANKKKTKMYEWSVTPVDIDGVVDSQSNLCHGDLVTALAQRWNCQRETSEICPVPNVFKDDHYISITGFDLLVRDRWYLFRYHGHLRCIALIPSLFVHEKERPGPGRRLMYKESTIKNQERIVLIKE